MCVCQSEAKIKVVNHDSKPDFACLRFWSHDIHSELDATLLCLKIDYLHQLVSNQAGTKSENLFFDSGIYANLIPF